MAESQKKAASTSKSQKSNSLLDEEIGKEFLGSWKSMSMVEDDAQVFNCKTMSKGKKSTFIFDKLDMDFSIDGDFGKKISSFKVDMSDLDFSSPPKKPLKPKERQKQESSSGNLEEKQDDFAFAFDFNELDNFDLDSTMMKGEKKSDKFVNDKGSDSPVKNAEKQDSRSIFAASTEATENSTTNTSSKLKHVDLKSECLRGALGSLDSPGDDYSIPENLGNLNVSGGKKTPPHKEITNSANGEDHYIKWSQMASSTGTNGRDTIKYSCVQPVTGVDANQESFQESQVDIYPSATETNVSLGGGQDNGCKQIAGLEAKLANASNLDGSPLACIAGSQNTKNEFENLENQNGASPGFINRKESVQCDRAIARISQRKPHTPMPTMERKISGSKLPLGQLLSGPKVNKDMPLRGKGPSSICSQFFKGLQEKGPSSICSQFFKGSEETGSQVNKNDMHQIPADARRQDISTGDSKAGNQKFNTPNDSSETEGLPITLGSVKKNEDHKASAGFQVHVARSPKRATNLGSLKCINSELIPSVALTKNSRSTSVEGGKPSSLESGNKPLHIAGLKVSRSVLSSNNLFTLRPQKQIKSQWQSEGNNTMHEHVAGKMVHAVSADIQGLSGPSMKRKISEEPNADPMTQHPLKRITDLPNESGTLEAVEEDKKQVGDNKNLLGDYHSISTLDASHDTSLIELEVPSLMENNGNVQKAEVCAKELEDICKILKKKHEEAKEVLVRAIVNNNNLLMLNHPSYEVKIRDIQRFAANLMSRKLQL